jgi:MoaA/NifB/PqqE/SkfB family radical SAM enzyme
MKLSKAVNVAARSLTPNKPHHAQWLVTRKCNYRCRGCNVWTEQDNNELSVADIKRGLDILKKIGIVEIVFSGGDPLLRPDIGEILDYASKNFVTTVYDNGSIAAQKIDILRNVDFVAISFDSLDPAKFDYIKGVSGSFDKAVKTIDQLQKEGIKVCVTPTISQMNLGEIVDITNHFTSKGIPVWYCLYSFDLAANKNQLFRIGKPMDEFVITDKHAMVNLCDTLLKMRKTNNRILMTDRLIKAMRSLYSEEHRTWKCKALDEFLIVDHMGRVGGCHNQHFAGTIFDLPKTWNSQEFDDLREKYGKCEQCTYLCYIFYSLHSGPSGNLAIAKEQWKNAKLMI